MYQFFVGGILGFLFWKFFAGKYEGDRPQRSFRFLVRNYWIHIHHWVWCAIFLIVLYISDIRNLFLYGVLVGSIIQGLTYRDWFLVIYHKDNYQKLYSEFRNE